MKALDECKVLIVDDTEENIDILVELLGEEYDLSVATDGYTALEVAAMEKPDIILLDIMMPEMDGYEVCKRLKSDDLTKEIPIIFLTGMSDVDSKTKAFQLGGVDYITKPFEMMEVKERLKTHLYLGLAKEALARQNELLEEMVTERTRELMLTQDATIEAIACLAEFRDPTTGSHIRRTKEYIKMLAVELKESGVYADQLSDHDIMMIYKSAPLHDIGKVGIDDSILRKPGKLTEEEYEIMKSHAEMGYEALKSASDLLGDNSFLKHSLAIAHSHQEKWDGTGYPQQLKGHDIPIAGRIMALADVYDALTTERPYKDAFTHEEARAIICDGRGSHFDPAVVDAFLRLETSFQEVRDQYADEKRAVLV